MLQEIVRKVLLTYWNTASFLTLYADANDWSPARGDAPAVADRSALDRWALSEAHRLVGEVTEAYEAFDSQRVGRLLATYVHDMGGGLVMIGGPDSFGAGGWRRRSGTSSQSSSSKRLGLRSTRRPAPGPRRGSS